MLEATETLWRHADARKQWCEAMRDCLGAVATLREADALDVIESWAERIATCDEIKTACEAEVAKEIDGDPDQWLRDAYGE